MIEANIRDGTQKSTGSATLSSLKKKNGDYQEKNTKYKYFSLCLDVSG
jgi:hypothetical protein